MARRKTAYITPTPAAPAPKEHKPFMFGSIQRESSERLRPYELNTQHHYIKYGDDDLFPWHLIELVNNSSIHNTCVNAIVDAIYGEGLTSNLPFTLDKANNEGESWNDIFAKVARDYKIFGGFALEVIWNNSGNRIAEVFHIDFSYLRAREKNERHRVPGYYLSEDWGYRGSAKVRIDDLPFLPVFNPSKALEQPNQIIYYQPYRPGQKYYPLPDYVGALKVVELDAEVDNFHMANIKNGLAPSLMITTYTNASEDDRRIIENMLRQQFAGSSNAGSLMYIDTDSKENAPDITPIPQNGADGYYANVNDMVMQKIITAHRITSPMMFGIKEAGQLGGRTEVIDAYLLLLNQVIKPYQQNILNVFKVIFDINYGEEVQLGVIQLKLYDDNTEEVDVVTASDEEAGVAENLETDIEQVSAQPRQIV
jgi:hypothetical protein